MQYRSFLFVLLLVSGTTGCGLLATAPERRASLTVANHSHYTICSIQVAEHALAPRARLAAESFESLDDPDWSENLLGSSTIEPGHAHTVPVPAGRWDLRMDDCRGRVLYARRAMRIVGAVSLDFRPIQVQRPTLFSRRRIAQRPAGAL